MKSISLIGFSGVGKTTVGKILARKLGLDFIDTDDFIERRYHTGISEMFASCGVDKFRKREQAALIELTQKQGAVLSTGGGLPVYPGNMDLLMNRTTVVYLRADPEELVRRLALVKETRPLVAGKTEDEIREYVCFTLPDRELFYQRAHFTVDATPLVTEEDAEAVADEIIAVLRG
ncbi:MAG: shikimate kinase [Porphyromonas sp.]|nr:shikimate kinase [Bacteroidales bacterium]MDY3101215.1 shikimate kinase [Porphyromonas sp.]